MHSLHDDVFFFISGIHQYHQCDVLWADVVHEGWVEEYDDGYMKYSKEWKYARIEKNLIIYIYIRLSLEIGATFYFDVHFLIFCILHIFFWICFSSLTLPRSFCLLLACTYLLLYFSFVSRQEHPKLLDLLTRFYNNSYLKMRRVLLLIRNTTSRSVEPGEWGRTKMEKHAINFSLSWRFWPLEFDTTTVCQYTSLHENKLYNLFLVLLVLFISMTNRKRRRERSGKKLLILIVYGIIMIQIANHLERCPWK